MMIISDILTPVLTGEEAKAKGFRPIEKIEELYSHATLSFRRLPIFELVCERFARRVSDSIRKLANDFAATTIEAANSSRFSDVISKIEEGSLIGVCRLDVLGGFGLIVFDQRLVNMLVDLLLGGRKMSALETAAPRPYTTIERNLVERMLKILIKDFSAAFETQPNTNFLFERLETSTRFAHIEKLSAAVFHAQLRIEMDDRGGVIQLIIPFSTIEPLCITMAPQTNAERDLSWQPQWAEHLVQTEFDLEVILDQTNSHLVDVINWKPGSQIFLLKGPESQVTISCQGEPLFRATVGHSGPRIAVSIDEVLK